MNMATTQRPESLQSSFLARGADVALIRNGYLKFPIDAAYMKPRFEAIIAGMKRLTDTPDAEKIFPWRAHRTDCYGPGYEQEVGTKFSHDDELKWRFQHTAGAFVEDLKKREAAPFRPMLEALDDIHDEAFRVGRSIAACLDVSNRRRDGKKKYRGSLRSKLERGICITRVLRYVASGQGIVKVMKAKTHFDRDVLTPHWWGTHPGLEVLDADGNWVKAEETSYDSAILFPGEKFSACTDNVFDTFGTAHGIWCEDTPHEDRYAIVSFLHPEPNPQEADWLKSNKPLIDARETAIRAMR
jgi:hypothetical protein